MDAVRLFLLSDSPPERDVQWTMAGAEGAWRLISRVWSVFDPESAGNRRRPPPKTRS